MKVSKTERIALLKSRRAIEEQRRAQEALPKNDILFLATMFAFLAANAVRNYCTGKGLKWRDRVDRQNTIKWLFGFFVVSPAAAAICEIVLPDGTVKEVIRFFSDWVRILMEV